MHSIFMEILATVPDRHDQKSLRMIGDHLWSAQDRHASEQAKLVSDMRRELEELQRKLKQS